MKPGTALADTLKGWGVRPCGRCRALQARMDRLGCGWCRDNVDAIAGQMVRNAGRLGMVPFSRRVARRLVLRTLRTCCGG